MSIFNGSKMQSQEKKKSKSGDVKKKDHLIYQMNPNWKFLNEEIYDAL